MKGGTRVSRAIFFECVCVCVHGKSVCGKRRERDREIEGENERLRETHTSCTSPSLSSSKRLISSLCCVRADRSTTPAADAMADDECVWE